MIYCGRFKGNQVYIINTMDMSQSKLWEIVKDREAWGAIVYGVTKSQTISN